MYMNYNNNGVIYAPKHARKNRPADCESKTMEYSMKYYMIY